MTACPGTYALILYNRFARTISIGKHGEFCFPGDITCTSALRSGPAGWRHGWAVT